MFFKGIQKKGNLIDMENIKIKPHSPIIFTFQTGDLKPIFHELDILGMLAACLCHDLDHRGTNNAFQVK